MYIERKQKKNISKPDEQKIHLKKEKMDRYEAICRHSNGKKWR
jgi:hypothetical protein